MARRCLVRKVPPSPPSREPYWEREQPQQATAGRVSLSYFRQAGILQMAQRSGPVVTLDQEDAQKNPAAIALLARVIRDWQT